MADPRPRTTARAGTQHSWLVLALLAMVVLLDQSTKWWGWRHVPDAVINSGGDVLVGHLVGGWYADPASGALLDLVGVGLLSSALFGLLRGRRPTVALVSVALMIAGWAWPDFVGWRVNYERAAYQLAREVSAPPALWSGPRRFPATPTPPHRPPDFSPMQYLGRTA